MSNGPIIRTLSDWTEQRITALYVAQTKSDFTEAFNAFVSKHVEITLNGKKISREHFEEQLWAAQEDKRSASVSYLGAVDVPKNASDPLEGGDVGLFAKTTIYVKDVVIGRPGEYFINASYNFVIIEDKTITWPHPPGGPGPVIPPLFFTRASVINCISSKQAGLVPLATQGN